MIANYNMVDKKTDILIFTLPGLFGGEVGGITPIYSPFGGVMTKTIYIGGAISVSFLIDSESPIQLSTLKS